MTNASLPRTSPISADSLSPDALEQLLQRIDENLELRPLLLADDRPTERVDEELMLAALPDMGDISARLHSVRAFNAPYFLTRETGLRGLLKKILNLPLRVFGYKQAVFNGHALDILEALAIQAHALRHRSEQLAMEARQQRRWLHTLNTRVDELFQEVGKPESGVAEKAETNRQRIDLLRADLGVLREQIDALHERPAEPPTLRTDLEGVSKWLHQVVETQQELARELNGHSDWIQKVVESNQRVAEGQHGHTSWMHQVVKTQEELARQLQGHTEWITLVQREAQAAALAARTARVSGSGPGSTGAAPVEPRVHDQTRYDTLVASMPDGLRVNLGCGIRPKDGWINVDFRPLSHVDVVADIRKLPFEPGSIAELEAAHLVEHFRQHEMQEAILPYWRSLLKPGGTLRVICPNAAAILARSAAGRLTLPQVQELIFGGQEYDGNDHFAMYWPESLEQTLRAAGFSRVDVVVADRDNGICPEQELLAHA
jgi:hypothetical protein